MTIADNTKYSRIQLSDFPAGGAIGTATNTIDKCTSFEIAQTTANQVLTLPTPSDISNTTEVVISNTGTAAFTIYGLKVSPGQSTSIYYSDTVWRPEVAMASSIDDFWSTVANTKPDGTNDLTESIRRLGHVGIGGTLITDVAPNVTNPSATNNYLQLSNSSTNRGQLMYGNNPLIYYMERVVPVTANGYIEIGNLTLTAQASSIIMGVNVSATAFATAKIYMFSLNWNATAGVWKVLKPTTDGGTYVGQDFEILVNVNNNTLSLRLRRVSGVVVGTAKIYLMAFNDPSTILTESTSTGTDATIYATIGGASASGDFWRDLTNTLPDGTTDTTDSIRRLGNVGIGGGAITDTMPTVTTPSATNNYLQLSSNALNRGQLMYGNNPLIYYTTRNMPTVVNNYVDIGSITMTNQASSLLVSINVSDTNFSVAKLYAIALNQNATGTNWRVLIPLSDGGINSAQNYELLIKYNLDVLSFRIRRTLGTNTGTARIYIHSFNDPNATLTELTTGGTDATVYTALDTVQAGDFWRDAAGNTPDSNSDTSESIRRIGNVGIGGATVTETMPTITTPSATNNLLHLSNTATNRGQLMYGSSPLSYYMERTSPTVVNNYVDIGTLNLANSAHSFRLSVSVETLNYTISKQYMVNVGANYTTAGYKIIEPITSSLTPSSSKQDFQLLMNVVNGLLTLRLRKSVGTLAGTFKIRLEYLSNGTVAFSESIATGTDAGAYSSIIYIPIDTVKFASVLPAVNGSEVDGDHLILTSNGTSTGVTLFEYLFSKTANAWKLVGRHIAPYRLVAGATTFLDTDNGGIIDINSAGAVNLTFPSGILNNSNGVNCIFTQLGAGAVTAVGGAGVTINSDISATTFGANTTLRAYYRNNGANVQVGR